MKAAILCGGKGTRLGEHGLSVPKALIPIGGRPIIWHLLKIYAHYGIQDFVLCLGYLGEEIRSYVSRLDEPFNIECVDTGPDTNTGGRLLRVREQLSSESTFCVTYGDGLADIDLRELLAFHHDHGKIASVTAVHPHSNFGLMDVAENGEVTAFHEKPPLKEWINGGFFVFQDKVFEHLNDSSILEREPFQELASAGQMKAFKHEGFWKCMDTFKDNMEFEQLWRADKPWKVWADDDPAK